MLRSALAAAITFALPAAARAADIETLSTNGFWRTYTTVTNDGVRLCGTVTRLDNGGAFYLKWFKGQAFLTVQVFKRGWAIPPGIEAPLRIQFPDTEPWTVRSSKLDHTTAFLEFYIPPDKVQSFSHDFTASPDMRLEFGSGDERPWTMNLAGSTPSLTSLIRCIQDVAGPDDPNQPFATARATQPFAPGPNGSGTSQPFTPVPTAPPSSQPFTAPPGNQPASPSPGGKQFAPEPGDING